MPNSRWTTEGPTVDHDVSCDALHRPEILTGVHEVRARIEELAQGCSRSLWAFHPGGAQSAASLTAARPLDQASLDRGVELRTLYVDSVRNDDATATYARWLTAHGAELRTAPTLPMRLLVIDQEIAVVPIEPTMSSRGAAILTSPGIVHGFVALFLAVWRVALPFTPCRPRQPGPLTAQHVTALELWAQGATDQSVAHQLGVSHRTVRRISESLSVTLGARSRFELGLRACEQGLVRSSDLA